MEKLMLVPDIPLSTEIAESDRNAIDSSNNITDRQLDTVLEYRHPDIYSELLDPDNFKAYVKFIKGIERQARNSIELRRLVRYLNEDLDMDKCAILEGVSSDDAKIEVHHYPFTLFDLTDIIIRDKVHNKVCFSAVQIAEELVQIHYLKMVGMVPLSKTVHELAHSGKVFINLRRVFGDVKEFVIKYQDGLREEHIDLLSRLIDLSDLPDSENLNRDTLAIKLKSWMDEEKILGPLSGLTEENIRDSLALPEKEED